MFLIKSLNKFLMCSLAVLHLLFIRQCLKEFFILEHAALPSAILHSSKNQAENEKYKLRNCKSIEFSEHQRTNEPKASCFTSSKILYQDKCVIYIRFQTLMAAAER